MDSFLIHQNEAGQRLDKYLMRKYNNAPRSLIYKWLRKKKIKLNRRRAQGNELLSEGDEISCFLPQNIEESLTKERTVPAVARQFDIIFENPDILVINKPRGLICHGDHKEDKNTLQNQVLFYCKDTAENAAICNRLDRNTTGLVLAGKNLQALQQINRAIQQRNISKQYYAIVAGTINKAGEICTAFVKDNESNMVDVTSLKGKEAKTLYRPVLVGKDFTLLELTLITGRSHQIRAHLRQLGHPILGDPKYGNKAVNQQRGVYHQMLHGVKIQWKDAQNLAYLFGKEFQAPIPEDFQRQVMKIFGQPL